MSEKVSFTVIDRLSCRGMHCSPIVIGFAICTSLACSPSNPNAKSGSDATAGSGGSAGTVASGGATSGGGGTPASPIPSQSTQLVTVISANWQATPATLTRYEGTNGAWAAIGTPVAVVIGQTGLGWGIGLHPAPPAGDPVKHEGDGRSPAGVFSLGTTFGYATPDAATWIKMPYLQATDDLECVDDPSSSRYNQLVYKSSVANVDWTSSELMKRSDILYRWGLFVEHNSNPPQAGSGSCIFLHTWSGPTSTTVGCTAGDETQMKEVYGWLDPAKHPVLVQLPQPLYDARRAGWALP